MTKGDLAPSSGDVRSNTLNFGFAIHPYLVQVEGNPIVEHGILERGCRWAGVGDLAGTELVEDTGHHGMAEDTVHALLRDADLRGYVGIGGLAMERDQVRNLELDHDLQRRKIVLDLHSSSMSFLLLLVCEMDCTALAHPRMQ